MQQCDDILFVRSKNLSYNLGVSN